MKKEEKKKVKRLNVDFITVAEHELLHRVRVVAAERELRIREVVIKALEQFVDPAHLAHDPKKK